MTNDASKKNPEMRTRGCSGATFPFGFDWGSTGGSYGFILSLYDPKPMKYKSSIAPKIKSSNSRLLPGSPMGGERIGMRGGAAESETGGGWYGFMLICTLVGRTWITARPRTRRILQKRPENRYLIFALFVDFLLAPREDLRKARRTGPLRPYSSTPIGERWSKSGLPLA